MSGISLGVELDAEGARQRLRELLQRMDDRRPFFKDVGDYMMGEIGRRFATEIAPDGPPWKPLAKSTIKSRIRRKRSPEGILRDYGHLRGSIHPRTSNDELRIGSPAETAAIHQLGGTINMPARAQKLYYKRDRKGQIGRRFIKKEKANHTMTVDRKAHTITIPARPFLGLSDADQEEIFAITSRWLRL